MFFAAKRKTVFNNINNMRTLIKFSLLLTLTFTGFLNQAFAQDIIHTLDRKNIEAKVLEINDFEIIYKSFDYLDGPDYKISLDKVISVDFENGTKRSFPKRPLGIGPKSGFFYGGPMDFYRGPFYRGGRHWADDSLVDYVSFSMYGSEYMKAKSKYSWGVWLTISGVSFLTTAVIVHVTAAGLNDIHRDEYGRDRRPYFDMRNLYIPLYAFGAVSLGAGIPLWRKGSKGLRKLADDYNRLYEKENAVGQVSLRLGTTPGGLGLALNF